MKEIKSKKIEIVNGQTLIVGVDIAKVKNFGYYRCPDGTEVKPFEFFNNGCGFNKFWDCISRAKRMKGLDEVVVGVESTGVYAEPLLHYLRKRGVRIVQVNPMHTKKLKELQGNSPSKTDYKDSKVIADIIELGHALTVVIPEGPSAELRRLTLSRERAIERRTGILNQLHDLVFIVFPELLDVMKGIKNKSSRYLLKCYPVPQDVMREDINKVVQLVKKISRGRIGMERIKALYGAAKESVGIKEGQGSIVFEIMECISVIEASDTFIAAIEMKMSNYLREIPYSRFILSLKGIGNVTASGLIGEVGDFGKFKTISELMKHAGLDLFEISSGKHKGRKRISKRGRSLLRKLLFFASINMVRTGGVMYEYYQRHLHRGTPKIKALIAVSRKLLGIIFALVRNNSVYVEDYQKMKYQLQEAA